MLIAKRVGTSLGEGYRMNEASVYFLHFVLVVPMRIANGIRSSFVRVGYPGRSSTSDSPSLFIDQILNKRASLTKGGGNRISYFDDSLWEQKCTIPVDR